jgi:hypothetical protein
MFSRPAEFGSYLMLSHVTGWPLISEWCCGHTAVVAPYFVNEDGAVVVVVVEGGAVVEVRGERFGSVTWGAVTPPPHAETANAAIETSPIVLAKYLMRRHMG